MRLRRRSAVYTRFQVDRCLKYAFEYARKYGKKARGKGDKNTLALCGKTNVLTFLYDLWERAFHEMGKKIILISHAIIIMSMRRACGW